MSNSTADLVNPKTENKGRIITSGRQSSNRQRFHPTSVFFNGQYYEHRFSLDWLDKLATAVPHHGSALGLKRNMLLRTTVCKQPSILNKQTLNRIIVDYLRFGNSYIEPEYSWSGKLLKLHHSQAMWTRQGAKDSEFWWIDDMHGTGHRKIDGELFKLVASDTRQEIYGIPDYVAGLHSAILNSSATLFRSEYIDNKVQLRFILHITSDLEEEVVDSIEDKIKGARGLTVEDLLIHDPDGNEKGVNLIPVSSDISKDDFINVNKATVDAMASVHRVPMQLMGVPPENAGGYGDAATATRVYVENEIIPEHELFLGAINQEFGDLIGFEEHPMCKQAASTI